MTQLFKRSLILAACGATTFFALNGTSVTAAETEKKALKKIDPTSGMIIAENWLTVQAMCSSCHSPKLFTDYGGTRETWAGLIDWMQKKQGLWEFPPKIETQILDYLEENYPPGEASRRRNLSANLRPPNPYTSEARAEYEEKLKRGEIVAPKIPTEPSGQDPLLRPKTEKKPESRPPRLPR